MTRELNQLIKKLKTLSPDEVARVQQFLQHVKSPELRAVTVELKAVPDEVRQSVAATVEPVEPEAAGENSAGFDASARREASCHDSIRERGSLEAQGAHEACEQWRRRPFQAIDADDLQPIAALFREAVDIRASSRFRFGSR